MPCIGRGSVRNSNALRGPCPAKGCSNPLKTFDTPQCRCHPDARHEKRGESFHPPRARFYREVLSHEHRKCTLNKTYNGRGSTHRVDESIVSRQMAYRTRTRLHVASGLESHLAFSHRPYGV